MLMCESRTVYLNLNLILPHNVVVVVVVVVVVLVVVVVVVVVQYTSTLI